MDYMNNNVTTTTCKGEPVEIGVLVEKKQSWNWGF